jgi:hypothetical protein
MCRKSLFLIILFCCDIYAQEASPVVHFSIFGGAAFPLGEFTRTTEYDAGFANTGYCALVEVDKNINKYLYWLSSVSLAVNGMDQSSMQNLLGNLLPNFNSNLYRYYGGTNVSAGQYTTTWAMMGFGYELPLTNAVRIYSVEQIGILMSIYPDISESYYINQSDNILVPYPAKAGTATLIAGKGTALATELGAGIIINNINLSLRYYTGEPYYKMTTNISEQFFPNGYTYVNTLKLGRTAMPVTLLQFMIGYNL